MEAGRISDGRSQERPKTFPRGRSLKVYRASRWSAIGLIGDPAQKTVLDEAGFLMEAFTCAWRINRIRRLSEFGTSLRQCLRHRYEPRPVGDPASPAGGSGR